jgi:tRNA nucleotidyltransferase (CCA-adding enzyme)
VHRTKEMRDATVLELLEATDAFRRPDRFERMLLACEADARGRGPELRKRPYSQAEILRQCRQAAAGVKLEPPPAPGESGPAIAQRLRSARVAAIHEVRSASSPPA